MKASHQPLRYKWEEILPARFGIILLHSLPVYA